MEDPMTIEKLEALFGELVLMVQDARMEARALRQMLTDHKVISEDELEARIKDVTRDEEVDLKAEVYRRALRKKLEDGPVQ